MCLDVLFIQKEWNRWADCRFWSYGAHLALAESLRHCGVRCTVVTEDCISENKTVFSMRKYDQIWFNDLVHIKREDAWYHWLASFAPVRVGLIIESLNYSPEEISFLDELRTRKMNTLKRSKYMTHVLACDERDASEMNEKGNVQAMWSPFTVPEASIQEKDPNLQTDKVIFLGTPYGKRKEWIENPALSAVLSRPKSLEDLSIYPTLFNLLRFSSTILPSRNSDAVNAAYMRMLIYLRKKCYSLYLKTLSSGCAVINFPHFVKTYSPRVVEGIAMGQPVVSWEIPDRPLNKQLFEEGQEILLYPIDDLERLQFQVHRVLTDRTLRRKLSQQAVKRVKAYHTSRQRVKQALKWIECGDVPGYA